MHYIDESCIVSVYLVHNYWEGSKGPKPGKQLAEHDRGLFTYHVSRAGGVGVANKDDCRLWGAGEVYQ